MPIGTPVPASSFTTRLIVPSPPATTTAATPARACSAARRAVSAPLTGCSNVGRSRRARMAAARSSHALSGRRPAPRFTITATRAPVASRLPSASCPRSSTSTRRAVPFIAEPPSRSPGNRPRAPSHLRRGHRAAAPARRTPAISEPQRAISRHPGPRAAHDLYGRPRARRARRRPRGPVPCALIGATLRASVDNATPTSAGIVSPCPSSLAR